MSVHLHQRIREIKLIQVTTRYPRLVGLNARRGIHGWGPTANVAVLVTERGAMGWGLSRLTEIEAAALTGRYVNELFDPAIGVIAPEALALDFALHDLAGVLLNEPVYALLGARGDRAIPCYDGAIYMDDLLPEEAPRGVAAVLANCQQDYEMGFRAFKLKIGRGHRWMEARAGLARDIEITRLVRERYPECDLLVDANDGYTIEGMLRYLAAVADCRLFWIEEPFRENRADLLRLRAALAEQSPYTYVADGETQPELPDLLAWAQEGLLDVLIMDIVGLGFSAWRRCLLQVAAAGASAAPHSWGDPLKTHYAAHLAAGLGHVLTLEGVPGLSTDVDWGGYRLEEGMLHVPDAPGFGMRLRGI